VIRLFLASLAAIGFAVLLSSWAAPAAEDPGFDETSPVATAQPTGKQLFESECGACHMAYPAALLPARSWQAITKDLSKHFGEDASLDQDTAARIAAYLIANAADAHGMSSPILRGLGTNEVPLLITDMPFWKRIHGRFPPEVFARPGVRTKANCLGCHRA